jgi:PTS system N-acetylglucosamine-specific IIC component
MSATPATTETGAAGWGSRFFAVLQRIGRSLMLPIAVLPAAAILLRLGQDDLLGPDGLGWDRAAEIVGNAGGALFDNLPLLFAVGVAVGFARRADGSTAVAALVGYLVFSNVLAAFGPMVPVDPACQGEACELEHDAPNVGVLGGIVIGLVAAVLWQRYYRIKLVPWLAFFGGRRFVPIITAFAALGLGIVFGLVWPPIGEALSNFAEWLYGLGPAGAGVYGAAPTGPSSPSGCTTS